MSASQGAIPLRTVRVDDATWAAAQTAADADGTTVTEVIRAALADYADPARRVTVALRNAGRGQWTAVHLHRDGTTERVIAGPVSLAVARAEARAYRARLTPEQAAR
jgi:hypothetical protein